MKFWYYLVLNYTNQQNHFTNGPLELFASIFNLHPILSTSGGNNTILGLLGDINQIVNTENNNFYVDQQQLYSICMDYETYYEGIDIYDSLWNLFKLPDTFNRYLASKARLYNYETDTHKSLRNYYFKPGVEPENIYPLSGATIEIYLSKEQITDVLENYDNLGMKKIIPSNTYNDWFLKDKQISDITENTVIINKEVWYKVYLFKFSHSYGQSFTIPYLQFNVSDLPYKEKPRIDITLNTMTKDQFTFINSVN